MSNIVTAKFCSDQPRAWTDELWQYDYGQVLNRLKVCLQTLCE